MEMVRPLSERHLLKQSTPVLSLLAVTLQELQPVCEDWEQPAFS